MVKQERGYTVQEVLKELTKCVRKSTPVFVVVQGERYRLEDVDTYDDAVHLTVGAPEDVTIIE